MPSNPILLDDVTDKVALVTGACGDIGQGIVSDLVKRGWQVIGSDIAIINESDSFGGRATYVQADVRDYESMTAAVLAAERFGTLRGAIANAGVLSEGVGGFLASDPAAWRTTMEVNLLGVLHTFRASFDTIADAGGGRMAATSSVAGVRAEADIVAYGATKAGVNHIIKSLALEFGRAAISVNAVAPGPVATALQDIVIGGRASDSPYVLSYGKRYEKFRTENRPFARLANVSEVGEMFGWLFSDQAAYMTGQVLVLDGGGTLT